MDKDRAQTKQILELTLEIIYLLIGEDYTVVKKTSDDGQNPVIVFPSHSIKTKQKVLEVIEKIMELLTGEVLKDEKMASQSTLESPDGSSNGNSPERCPCRLYSQNSTQEGHPIPHHHQNEDTSEMKVAGKEEEDETIVRDQTLVVENTKMTVTVKEEEIFAQSFNMAGECCIRKTSDSGLAPSPTWDKEGEVTTQKHPDKNSNTDRSPDPSNPEEPSSDTVSPELSMDRPPDPEGPSADRPCADISAGPPSPDTSLDSSNPEEVLVKPENSEPGPYFTWESNLAEDHMDSASSSFICSECGKSFALQNNLEEHRRTHTGKKPYSCSDCGKRFPVKSKLIQHVRVHTGEKPFPCPVCGRCFTTKTNLASHQIIHTDRKPFPCKECGKCFSRQLSLLMHQQTHNGNKDFTCGECGKSFAFKNYLRIHEKIHTGEKPFSCSDCGKCFVQRWALVIHERLHRGEKPYSCAECGRCFVDKGQLAIHQRIHTGERPYACSECYKSFVQKSALRRHQRTHTGERPFSCKQCGKCFAQKAQLVTHQKVHSAVRTTSCT